MEVSMRISRNIPAAVGVLWIAAAAVLAPQAGARVGTAPAARVATAETVSLRSTAYGEILVDSRGYTLYLWAKDAKDKSGCSGACLDVTPFVLISGQPTAGPGVSQKLLGTIKVKGGNELTYNGSPLYTFVSDFLPGLILGEGNEPFGGPWWVVSAAGKAITQKP
jgi:predicted lipoprotein with Yx(FWY)xxD motif